jgi:hypothetical protein
MANADEVVKQGITAFKAGRRTEAQELFQQALRLDKRNEQAWLWMSSVVETDAERRACLQTVLTLNPANAVAKRGLEHLQAATKPTTSPPPEETWSPKPIQPLQPQEPSSPQSWQDTLPQGTWSPEPQQDSQSQETWNPQAWQDSQPQESWSPQLQETVAPQESTLSEPEPVSLVQDPSEQAAKTQKDDNDISWTVTIAFGLVVICVFAAIVVALVRPWEQQSASSSQNAQSGIIPVLYEQVAAHNAEDIDRYMATMHSRYHNSDQMRNTLEDMYQKYDLKTTLSDVEIIEVSGNRAEVSFVLTTRKIRGPAFRDNRIRGIFILRKEDGEWKLYDQKVDQDDVEYLN